MARRAARDRRVRVRARRQLADARRSTTTCGCAPTTSARPKRDGAREDARDFGGAEGVAQLISRAAGACCAATPALGTKSLLTPLELQAARGRPDLLDRAAPPAFGERALAAARRAGHGRAGTPRSPSSRRRSSRARRRCSTCSSQLLLAGAAALRARVDRGLLDRGRRAPPGRGDEPPGGRDLAAAAATSGFPCPERATRSRSSARG